MKFSTRGRYGLKAVMELARREGQGPVSMRDLAESIGISAPYLEQLFKKLRAAGVIESSRGAQGGYALAKPLKRISVGDVIRPLEGSMAPAACAEQDFTGCQSDRCIEAYLYRKIRQSVDDVIDSVTLWDMLEKEKELALQRPSHACGAWEAI